jgi:hypothetical protein
VSLDHEIKARGFHQHTLWLRISRLINPKASLAY